MVSRVIVADYLFVYFTWRMHHIHRFPHGRVFPYVLSSQLLRYQCRNLSEDFSLCHVPSAALSCLCIFCCFFFFSFSFSLLLRLYSAKSTWPLLLLFWEMISCSILLNYLLILQHFLSMLESKDIFQPLQARAVLHSNIFNEAWETLY